MMKEVFRSPDGAQVGLFASILENEGIPSITRNAITQPTIVGGLATALFPIPDFWPTLCVLDDEDYPEAMMVLTEVRRSNLPPENDWRCVACGETVPGNFTSCWNCGSAREA